MTNGEVAAAYEAYKAAASNTQLKKAAYDAAKKAYDDAEAQLAIWQNNKKIKDAELAGLLTLLNAKKKVVTDLEAEIKALQTTISTNQTTYDNWPKGNGTVLKADPAICKKALEDAINQIQNKGTSAIFYYGTQSNTTTFSIWLKDKLPTATGETFSDYMDTRSGMGMTDFTSRTLSDILSRFKSSGQTNYVLYLPKKISLVGNTSHYGYVEYWVYNIPTTKEGLISNLQDLLSRVHGHINNFEIGDGYLDETGRASLYATLQSQKTTLSTKQSQLTTAKSEQATAQTNYDNKKKEVDALQAQIDGYTKVQSGKTESEQNRLKRLNNEAKAAYEKAVEAEDAAAKVYEEAFEAAKNTTENPYLSVTLTGDVFADVALSDYAGTINGAGFTITAGEGVDEVFTGLTGTLKNTAINGAFTASEAAIHNVAYWDGTNSGAYYANDGAKTEYHDLGELGFNVRKNFGVDFAENKLTALDETNKDLKVYHLTPYLGPGTEQTTGGYYQLKSGGTDGSLLVNAEGQTLTVPANHFILSSTADVADIALPNVFYQSNKSAEDAEPAYVSNLVEVDLGGESFYCPVNLTAKAVTVKGTIKTSNQRAGLCLPFALKPAYFPAGTSLCTFNRDNGPSFVFTKIAGDIAANTPVLIFSDQAEFELDFTGADMIHIARTPDDQIVKAGHDASGNSQSYGTFKAVTAGEIGQHEAGDWKVYALLNGKFTAAKQGNFTDDHVFDDVTGYGNVAKFKPFRMVITTKTEAGTGGSTNAPRFISIVDEQGNEIDNTAVIDCLGDATNGAFGVEGGAGLITITADADLGTVEIHDLAGRTVATPDVKAGVTTVSVPGGVYVVAGTKMLVK